MAAASDPVFIVSAARSAPPIVTLLHALEAQNLKRGVAALCIGGVRGVTSAAG